MVHARPSTLFCVLAVAAASGLPSAAAGRMDQRGVPDLASAGVSQRPLATVGERPDGRRTGERSGSNAPDRNRARRGHGGPLDVPLLGAVFSLLHAGRREIRRYLRQSGNRRWLRRGLIIAAGTLLTLTLPGLLAAGWFFNGDQDDTGAPFRNWKVFAAPAALAVVGLSLAAVLGRSVRRSGARRFHTCPKCLAEGTLAPAADDPFGEYVVCAASPTSPDREGCGFRFPSLYRSYYKYSFPTLGVPASGKTLWLTMLYHNLIRRRFPASIEFDRLITPGSERFDQMVEQVLEDRLNPSATMADIPEPIVFVFRDRDRLGQSDVLLNLFDFAGEVAVHSDLRSRLRRRQLQADGYFLFLDPTSTPELQSRMLTEFCGHLAILSRRRARFGVPLAICFSKLDLMTVQPYYTAGGFVDEFLDALYRIDPTGQSQSLEIMAARSEISERVLFRNIWPGWNLARQIQATFGDCWQIFPLTPVGINDLGNIDAADRANRVIDPYGILEPLLWLLHMQGHQVLEA